MVTLVTSRLVLTPPTLPIIDARLESDDFRCDVPVALAGGGVPTVWNVHFPPDWPGDALGLLSQWKENLESDPRYDFLGGIIIEQAGKVAAGGMNFRAVPGQAGTVELGYGINRSLEGRGYATEMARAMVKWATGQRHLCRIVSAYLVDNAGSIRVLEKTGFVRAGMRQGDEGMLIEWEYPRS